MLQDIVEEFLKQKFRFRGFSGKYAGKMLVHIETKEETQCSVKS